MPSATCSILESAWLLSTLPWRSASPHRDLFTTRTGASSLYASKAYRERLKEHGIRGSMTQRGNPYDNALVESFFKTFKHEEVLVFDHETVEDVIERLPRFLEEVYNRRRLHSALSHLPPEEFETLNRSPAA